MSARRDISSVPRKGKSAFDFLPPEVQEQVYTRYFREPTPVVVEWVMSELKIGGSRLAMPGRLTNWTQKYSRENRLKFCADDANAVRTTLESHPRLKENAEAVSMAAQIVFERRAMQRSDLKDHIALRKLRLKEREVAVREENLKSNLKRAFDALRDEVKGNTDALACIQRAEELVNKQMEGRAT